MKLLQTILQYKHNYFADITELLVFTHFSSLTDVK